MTLGVYKFFVNYGRMGSLEGVFVEHDYRVKALAGTEVHFGEILGKHSDVSHDFSEGDVQLISSDPVVVKVFQDNDIEVGPNPFSYIDDVEPEASVVEPDDDFDSVSSYEAFHLRVRALRAASESK